MVLAELHLWGIWPSDFRMSSLKALPWGEKHQAPGHGMGVWRQPTPRGKQVWKGDTRAKVSVQAARSRHKFRGPDSNVADKRQEELKFRMGMACMESKAR